MTTCWGVRGIPKTPATYIETSSVLGSRVMEIGFAEVHVWTFPLRVNESELADLEAALMPDEIARADRFLGADLRKHFVVARGRLRRLLGSYLGIGAAEIRFDYGEWGKPRLTNRPLGNGSPESIHFNLSHSGGEAAIAISRYPVGVDLEVAHPRTNHRAVRSQILSADEETAWQEMRTSQPDLETMRLWICKEAFLKATGLGIAEGLRKVDFPLPIPTGEAFQPKKIDGSLQLHLEEDPSCSRNAWLAPETWRLNVLDSGPKRYLAVCHARSETEVVHRTDWPLTA
ncbi:MAG: 4'-phosphopantetheinyl transferase superfamily protein [Planctomycetota bacterium]